MKIDAYFEFPDGVLRHVHPDTVARIRTQFPAGGSFPVWIKGAFIPAFRIGTYHTASVGDFGGNQVYRSQFRPDPASPLTPFLKILYPG